MSNSSDSHQNEHRKSIADYVVLCGLGAGVFAEADLLEGIDGPFDLIQAFVRDRIALEAQFPQWRDALAKTGMLWISWPKGSSKLRGDLSPYVFRKAVDDSVHRGGGGACVKRRDDEVSDLRGDQTGECKQARGHRPPANLAVLTTKS